VEKQIMKFRQWLQSRSRLILLPAALLCFVLSAQAQTDAILPPMGGGGGSQFVARCPQGQFLTGFKLRTGDEIDGIQPLCVTAYAPADVGPPQPYPSYFGGSGGGPRDLLCPTDAPIVTGLYIYEEGRVIITVDSIHLFCGVAATTQKQSQFPAAVFDAPHINTSEHGQSSEATQRCPAGLVAVGINGRSGEWLDSLGLICGVPTLTPKAAPPPEVPSSPAVKAVGRTKLPPGTAVNPPAPICDLAQEARARNNPAAPGLEEKCLSTLAARGDGVAMQDPLSAELRSREPEGPSRRGFDIGMAAAEGHTAPGPGKQRIHDLLSPAEQKGYEHAVAFSLERNRNADLAARGAAIARVDQIVAAARTAETDVFYWLGFDIATGIFGDPALGARGDVRLSPDSQKIRDSLSVVAQRGFDASVKLHLSRRYRRR
jgi:hypothetical protein